MSVNNLLKSIISISYGIVFIYLFLTEKLYLYIHPRMGKYIFIIGIIFLIIGIYNLKNIKINIYMKSSFLSFGILILPLIIGLTIDPSEIDNMISNIGSSNYQAIQANQEKVEFLNSNGDIEIREDNYLYAMKEIYFNTSEYEGKNIEFEGFIYRNEYLEDYQAMVGRNIIRCCIADASLLGYMIEGKIIRDLPDNKWVKIKGKLDTINFNGDEIPIIKVEKENIEFPNRPKNQYIFAN